MTDVDDALEIVRSEALVCARCDLGEKRTHVVFGEGNPNTPLMIIGEGPGEMEDRTGRPFVGRAGQLLDQALRENGITRKHVYIANVVKCRPTIVEGSSTRNRPPKTPEILACHPWLQQQIDVIKPLVILCLGAPSANEIIHKDFKMTKERGQFFPTPYARAAIAALHPAYVLRQVGEAFETARASLVSDIGAARAKVIELKQQPKLSLF